jgi:hypothetical protein
MTMNANPNIDSTTAVPVQTLQEIAAAILAECDGNVLDATAALVERIKSSDLLYRLTMDPLVKEAAYSLVRDVCRSQRRQIWNATPHVSSATATERAAALGAATLNSLLDFSLPGGKALRKATKAEINEAVEFYRKQANDMTVKWRWLEMVAGRLSDSASVEDVFTDDGLRRLRAKAEKAPQ